MNTDIMTILTERRRHNNYEKIDDICDELTALMGGNLSSTPVFYRDNMIIVRKTFLKSLFWSIKSEKLVRAVIYIVLCMLVLHAPVAVIRESEEKSDDENIKYLLNGFLDGYEYQGIFRETLIKHFGIERNTFTTAISILIRLKVIVQLTDGSYAFAIKPEKDILENRALAEVKEYLSDLTEIVTVFQQADLLTGMKTEDDGNKSDEIVFANEEEAAETVDAIGLLEREQNPDGLREELGDLLLQVMLQSRLAEEEGYFTVEDVVEDISRKMIRRHPHVFGETITGTDGHPLKTWTEIKAWEKWQMTYQEDPRRKKRRKKLVRILDRLLSL